MGARIATRMQRGSLTFVKKKYTTVLPMRVSPNNNSVSYTVSHIGGPNATDITNTVTLRSADPDGMATVDMAAY